MQVIRSGLSWGRFHRSKWIINRRTDMQQISLNIFGTAESGKSALFKQLKFMYGDWFSFEDLMGMKFVIIQTVYRRFLEVFDVAATREGFRNRGLIAFLNEIKDDKPVPESYFFFSERLAANIRTLWMTEEVQETWSNRSQYQFMESLEYYLDSGILEKFVAEDWIPNKEDIINLAIKTTGVRRETFRHNEVMIDACDHGGQRNERKKWIYTIDDASVVLFVVDVSDFDQMLWEDSRVNRLEEAVQLFRASLRSLPLQDKPVVLVFNKMDLLSKKLERFEKRNPRVNLDEYFPTLRLGTTWNAPEARPKVLHDITQRFMDIARLVFPDYDILPQYISAMDPNMCKDLFETTANIAMLSRMER